MSGTPKKSTYKTGGHYGPFKDGTVQTWFKESPPHWSDKNKWHKDFELVTPKLPKDKVKTIAHIPVKNNS